MRTLFPRKVITLISSVIKLSFLLSFSLFTIQALSGQVEQVFLYIFLTGLGAVFSYKITPSKVLSALIGLFILGILSFVFQSEVHLKVIFQLILVFFMGLPASFIFINERKSLLEEIKTDWHVVSQYLIESYRKKHYFVYFPLFAVVMLVYESLYFYFSFPEFWWVQLWNFALKTQVIGWVVAIILSLVYTWYKKTGENNLFPGLFLGMFIMFFAFKYSLDFVKNNPVITYINPTEGSLWTEVHIHGRNFGVDQYNEAAVFLDGVEHRVLRWDNDEVVFIIDPTISNSGAVMLQNVDQKESNSKEFTFIPL